MVSSMTGAFRAPRANLTGLLLRNARLDVGIHCSSGQMRTLDLNVGCSPTSLGVIQLVCVQENEEVTFRRQLEPGFLPYCVA